MDSYGINWTAHPAWDITWSGLLESRTPGLKFGKIENTLVCGHAAPTTCRPYNTRLRAQAKFIVPPGRCKTMFHLEKLLCPALANKKKSIGPAQGLLQL